MGKPRFTIRAPFKHARALWMAGAAAVGRVAPTAFEQVFFFGGLASIAYGTWLVYEPLGFIVGGLIAFWLATLISGERHAR